MWRHSDVPLASTSEAGLDAVLSSFEEPVAAEAARELRHLARFKAVPSNLVYPKRKLAAVLVLLHLNAGGQLSVTLTTRALKMRSDPGDTALPGGRWEDGDETIEATAIREAQEEVHLPVDASLLHLTALPAFAWGRPTSLLVVVPAVFFLALPVSRAADYISKHLSPDPNEVSAIFHLPLSAFLSARSHESDQLPSTSSSEALTLSHRYDEVAWPLTQLYRLHRFSHPSLPSSVDGLTADILVATALLARDGVVGFARAVSINACVSSQEFEKLRWAEEQLSWVDIVARAVELAEQQEAEQLVDK